MRFDHIHPATRQSIRRQVRSAIRIAKLVDVEAQEAIRIAFSVIRRGGSKWGYHEAGVNLLSQSLDGAMFLNMK